MSIRALVESGACARLRSLRIGFEPHHDEEEDFFDDSSSTELWQKLGRAGAQLTELEAAGFLALDTASLACFTRVTHLRLRFCPNLEWHSLHLCSLRMLNLHTMESAKLDTEEADSSLHLVLVHCALLVELSLYGFDLITGSCFALRDGVGCRLRRLALSNCIGLTNRGMLAVATHPLEKLTIDQLDFHEQDDLSDDVITADGLVDLAVRCPLLTHLNLDLNGAGTTSGITLSVEHLRRVLEACGALVCLITSQSAIERPPVVTCDSERGPVPANLTVALPSGGVWRKVSTPGRHSGYILDWCEKPLPSWQAMRSAAVARGRTRFVLP